MTLRARLVTGLVALALVGLAAAGVATYLLLGSFLAARVDQQLAAAPVAAARMLAMPAGAALGSDGGRPGPPVPATLPPGTYAELRQGTTVLRAVAFGYGSQAPPAPRLPARMATGVPITVAAHGQPWSYRAEAFPLGTGATLVVAIPLADVASTLHRLLVAETGVALAVLVGLGVLAWWVVGVGLRPLRRMQAAAAAIAAGDLSRRVEDADPRTETGRLGGALNVMLARIEEAFAARVASEARLRRFLADASHELRTPLTSIRGYAELFRRGADTRPDDLAKAMRRIEDESARMGTLVDELLLLARLDEQRPLERAPVDLTRLVADTCADARAADASHPVTLESPPGPVMVDGDEARLRQVVANLLANTRVHTPAGTPVRVELGIEGSHAHLVVADRGPGLPAGQENQVFDRFYRADASRNRRHGGAGLGLSIVAGVVTAHGGRVQAANDPAGGARLTVDLPLARRDSQAVPSLV
ncbi:MAG: sensor histidine kinase [Actinomycetes bacterium]